MFGGFLCWSFLYSLLLIVITALMRRSALTESLLRKYEEDERHKADDHKYWYEIKMSKVDPVIQKKFIQLYKDEETMAFLHSSFEKSDALLTQIWHAMAVPFLKLFMTQTNVNGYLDRGSMFVFSTSQFRNLVGVNETWRANKMLDLGAGDGKVTEKMAMHFNQVFATEISTQMQKHLRYRGYEVLDIDKWSDQQYDLISCLNLLDRCDKPVSLLRDIKSSLKEDGYLIVAAVAPFSPYVEMNSSNNYKPSEVFHLNTSSIEDQINDMVIKVFDPAGFYLRSFSRVPYLCEGDLSRSFYVLNDIIFVLKPKPQ